jgi:hypothetical protein
MVSSVMPATSGMETMMGGMGGMPGGGGMGGMGGMGGGGRGAASGITGQGGGAAPPGSVLNPPGPAGEALSSPSGKMGGAVDFLKNTVTEGVGAMQDAFGMGGDMTYEKAESIANASGEKQFSGEWWDKFDSAGSPDKDDGSPKGKEWWKKFGSALKGAGKALGGVSGTKSSRASVTSQNPFQGSSQPARNTAAELLLQSLSGGMAGPRR